MRLIASLPHILVAVAFLAVVAAIVAQDRPPPGEAQALHALFAAEWDHDMQQDPVRASTLGDRRWNDRWPDVSPGAHVRRQEHYRGVLARLAALDRARLSPADQLNYDLFKREYETRVEEIDRRWHLVALNQREGLQTRSELARVLRFETRQDCEDWIGRLRSFPAYVDQTIDLMREGVRTGLLQPKLVVERVLGQVRRQIVGRPEESPFFEPFTRMPPSLTEAERARLAGAARDAIAGAVVPAFERLGRFLAGEYLPAAYDRPGIWQAPDGRALYHFFIRKFTGARLTAEEVHRTGLSEVDRIGGEMRAIMRAQGFPGTLQEFFTFLRTDPRFYYDTPAALLDAYRATAKRIDPGLVKVFRTLPRTPYGVEPIPDLTAPDTTTAYYQQPAADGSRAGTYYVNLHRPETRPTYEMMALSLHEAVPGHHLQIALAMEQGALPQFRRHGDYTAFVEGWALYAESLGDEMGLYDDPYAKFGQLTYEMWRAVRLVVDTGLHALQWDRQRAIDFFRENAAKTEIDIVNEVDRYIAWPGQALAYKIGELRLKEIRRRAEAALGDRFDLREFHDAVLAQGAVTLDTVEAGVAAWIERRRD